MTSPYQIFCFSGFNIVVQTSGKSMLINTEIANQKFMKTQNFGRTTLPNIVLPKNTATNPVLNTEINLNNTPSVQNKVVVQQKQSDYREIQTFRIPNIGEGKIYELKNGHKVVILPKAGRTVICTQVKVGGSNTSKDKKEMSHYLEHMLAGQHEFKKAGIEANAMTYSFNTNYFAVVPVENDKDLEKVIQLQVKTLQYPKNGRKRVDNERRILAKELGTQDKIESSPDYVLFNTLFNTDEFSPDAMEDRQKSLENITEKDLINHYNTYYKPSNMVTTIVGNVDFETAMKFMSQNFGQINPADNHRGIQPDFTHPIQSAKRIDMIESADAVKMAFAGAENPDSKDLIMGELLHYIFINRARSFSDKVVCSLRTDVCGSQGNSRQFFEITPLSLIDEKSTPKEDLKDAYAVIFDIAQNPVSDEILEKSKEQFKNKKNNTQQNSEELAKFLCLNITRTNTIGAFDNYDKTLKTITAKDIQEFAKKHLDLNKASILVFHKENKAPEVTFKGKNNINEVDVEEYELKNNVRVLIDSAPNITRTTISINLGISSKNPIMPNLLADMINEKDCDRFADYLWDSAMGKFYASSSQNRITLTLDSPPDKTLLALKTLREKTFDLELTEEDFNHSKDNLRKEFEINKNSTWSLILADKKFGNYTFSDEEKDRALDNVEFKDAKHCLKQPFTIDVLITIPQNTYNKDKNTILNLITKDFPHSDKIAEIIPLSQTNHKELEKSEIIFEETKEGLTISKAYKLPVTTNVKDRVAIRLIDSLLSRAILEDLREKQNICYSAGSLSFINDDGSGVISLDTSTISDNPENMKKILEGFDYNSNRLMQIPVSEEDLERAKMDFKNDTLGLMENSRSRNKNLEYSIQTPYGKEHFNERLKIIDEIRPEHIQRMAQLIFSKPSVTTIETDQKTFDANKKYLESNGKVTIIPIAGNQSK